MSDSRICKLTPNLCVDVAWCKSLPIKNRVIYIDNAGHNLCTALNKKGSLQRA